MREVSNLARYYLILKDVTYVKLVKIGASQNPPKSMGKLINEILDRETDKLLADGHEPTQKICIVCGRKATIEAHGKGQQTLFLCPYHSTLKKDMEGYKEL